MREHLGPPATILEIGCGDGRAASALADEGYRVIALDPDEDSVAAARERGVDAHRAVWPGFEAPEVDGLLFTRSLHHVGDLSGAIGAARAALGPAGALLIEEFARDAADGPTLHWFRERFREGRERVAYGEDAEELAELVEADDPMAAWSARFGEDFHAEDAMLSEVGARFRLRSNRSLPYLYRFLMRAVAPEPRSTAWIEEVLARERTAIRERAIRPLGRRYVARPRETER